MAKKIKKAYFCKECGYESAKWLGRCSACGEWNSFVEEILDKDDNKTQEKAWQKPDAKGRKADNHPTKISEIKAEDSPRIPTYDEELNRVLGGGIVPGSLILIGGEPGIGKSTLMLQLALALKMCKVLYVSGEESQQQIKMRADRLGDRSPDCYVLTETNIEKIFSRINELEPDIVIIDSIQTLYTSYIDSGAGSISQVRHCTGEWMRFSKERQIPVFLIGHITKDGAIAGPKILEHMVDTVLQFEGDRHLTYRLLRTMKNRFGSTSEIGIYEMRATGLREVSNPSEILISQRDEGLSGITIGATVEGNRPLLIEVQSLVSAAAYGTPQRSSTGYDAKRLNMLLAVLEKRGGYRLAAQDVFLNIAGGLKIEDPAIDLAVCMSVVSSYHDQPLPEHVCFTAEVGLGGEVRAISRIENRIAEAEKLGYREIYISKYNMKAIDLANYGIKVHAFGKLEDILPHFF
ncbi:MAG: DNA repair protein RadA [Bernardetiaceae bacterium]|nr:DNA repair protein RadA [Bernardetiaceae bacterium]